MKKPNRNFVAKTKDILGSDKDLPLRHISYHVQIVGARATVVVSQRFENEFQKAVDVEYLFPILSRSCLLEFTAATEEQTFVGIVGEKEQVATVSKKLKEKGVTHAVASNFQEFKDIVRVSVANLQPKQSLLIQLKFSLLVDVISQSTFMFRLPMVLLERFKEKVAAPQSLTKGESQSQDVQDKVSIQHSVDCGYRFSFELEVFKESASDIELHKLEPFLPEDIKVTNSADKKVFTLAEEKNPPNTDVFLIFRRIGCGRLTVLGDSKLDNIVSAQVLYAPSEIEKPILPRCAYTNFVLKSIGNLNSNQNARNRRGVYCTFFCLMSQRRWLARSLTS